MYAVIVDRNQQHLVREGERLLLDYNQAWAPGSEVVCDRVCIVGAGSGNEAKVGSPYVEGAKVKLEVVGPEKGDKIVVRKFKRRKNYRRKAGFRARYTLVQVKEIQV